MKHKATSLIICSFFGSLTGSISQAQAIQPEEKVDSGEIIVTAQKKSETLQKTPAAVSVIGNDRLTSLGVTNLTQVTNLTAGLSITPVRTQAFIFIRGVGQTLTSPNADAAVAVNLNSVYTPPEIAGTAFFLRRSHRSFTWATRHALWSQFDRGRDKYYQPHPWF